MVVQEALIIITQIIYLCTFFFSISGEKTSPSLNKRTDSA